VHLLLVVDGLACHVSVCVRTRMWGVCMVVVVVGRVRELMWGVCACPHGVCVCVCGVVCACAISCGAYLGGVCVVLLVL